MVVLELFSLTGASSSSRPNTARPRSSYRVFGNSSRGGLRPSSWSVSEQSDSGISCDKSSVSSRSLVTKGFNVLNPPSPDSWNSPLYASPETTLVQNKSQSISRNSMSTSVDEDTEDLPEKVADDGFEKHIKGLNLTCSSVEQLAAVIVSTVLKKVIVDISGQEMGKVEHIPEIRDICHSDDFSHLSLDMLDQITVQLKDTTVSQTEGKTDSKEEKLVNGGSDADSILDSEEEFDDSDKIFGKDHSKSFTLDSRKGIYQFKKFLRNSAGEKNWNFWIEIDKNRFLVDTYETQL